MPELTLEVLQTQLALKQKELDLILALDRIRDTVPEPAAMLAALVEALADHLGVDLCLICLKDRETKALQLKALCDRSRRWGELPPEFLPELEQQTLATPEVLLWEGAHIPAALRFQMPLERLSVAVVQIFLNAERLGAILVARTGAQFTAADVELLEMAESQVDSAVIQGYEYYTLQQRNKELETIYKIDHIRDQQLPFEEMLHHVLGELRQVIQAEAGFIMLYNQAEKLLELRAVTGGDLFPVTQHANVVHRIATESLKQARMVWYNELRGALHSIVCLPLILDGEIIGVLGVINRLGRQRFDAEDRRLLSAIGSQIDTAIFESLERRQLRQVLGRSVDPRVMEQLLAAPDLDILKSERAVVSVLYADIRGSTALAERIAPELLVGFINDYLGRMTDVILAHEGTLDKFVGDEVMALFGVPLPQPDHALRSIRAALAMQQAHQAVMETWAARGVERSPIGIGIATGELIVGEIGCPKRTNYTVIGRAANLGARLCGLAKGNAVVISQATYDLAQEALEATPITGVQVKGVTEAITVYEVRRII